MIDLSYLTEEEQESILAVLKRDAELKKSEEHRVQKLQKTVNDKGELKYLTGEWFYETKQLRHQERIHGSDIIMASMRHTQKPLTILELSQMLPEQSSFVSSENTEVFVPPLLCGLLQEPHLQPSHERYLQCPCDPTPDTTKPDLQSPTKQRKNPFNSELDASHTLEEEDSQSLDGEVDQTQTLNEEPMPSSDSSISYASDGAESSSVTQDVSVTMATPDNSSGPQDFFVEVDGQGDGQSDSGAARGILKRLSLSSPAETVFSHLDLQNPVSLSPPTESCADRKQVRFSPTLGQGEAEWQNGKELGEHSVLDSDSTAPSEMDNDCLNNWDLNNTDSANVRTRSPTLDHSFADSQEGEAVQENEANVCEQRVEQLQILGDVSEHTGHAELPGPAESTLVSAEQEQGKPVHLEREPEEDHHSQAKATEWPSVQSFYQPKMPKQNTEVSAKATSDIKPPASLSTDSLSTVLPQPRPRLQGMFRRREEKIIEAQERPTEEVKKQETKLGNGHNVSPIPAATNVDKRASVRTVQLAALQNTTWEETVTTGEAHTQRDITGGKSNQFPEILTNPKASCEIESTGPDIVFSREGARHEDISEPEAEATHGPQVYLENLNNISAGMEITTTGRSQEKILSPECDCNLFVNLSNEDGTYRANPILIYEETDDSLTGSTESRENYGQKHSEGLSDCPPIQSSSSPQEDETDKISQFKHFLETEYTGPRVISARGKETSSSSIFGDTMVSQESDRIASLDNRESKGEKQTCVFKSKSNVVLKSLNVINKGFASLRPLPRSSGDDGDTHLAYHQDETVTDSQDRPLSQSKSQTPRFKDQDQEVTMSPSKTRHPRVLSRESSSPKRSRTEDSPLKTFTIDIDPKTEEQRGKPSPSPRQRKSPSHAALTDLKPSKDLTSCPLPLHPQDRGANGDNVNKQQSNPDPSTSPQSKKAPENSSLNSPRLARSIVPEDYQHYLGPHQKAHMPLFHRERCGTGEGDALHIAQSDLSHVEENHSDKPSVGNRPRVSSWIVQKKNENPEQETAPWSGSLSRASSGSHEDSSTSIISALKRFSSRMSSKSVENLTSRPREEMANHDSGEQMNLSVDDVSSLPRSASTLSHSKRIKTSMSMPVLLPDETDSDNTSETNLGRRRNTGSSTSNISLSSGMESTSSVSGSTSSINPADFGDIEVQGNIQFAVNYIHKLEEFHIFVVNCRELAVADIKKNRSDPYVKSYLLPDKTKLGKRKTTVKKKTLNPNYNEILRFKIPMEVLKSLNLNISVWHNDTFGRNSFLGEVDLDMSEWDFRFTHINEYALKARVAAQTSAVPPSPILDSRGQMRVALRFLPQTSHSTKTSTMESGEVQIWVKDCKNLPSVRGVIIDPFVKCTVLPDTSKKSRQKTRVVKRTVNPMFNHTMVYDGFRAEDLREACVEITVWDHDRLNSHYIGGLRLGLGTGKSYGMEVAWMDSTTAEANLWQRMLQSDGEWVEDVLPLKVFVMANTMAK